MDDRLPSAVYPCIADKHVLVTGGASGIGEGLVEAFVSQGAKVVFIDLQAGPGEALAQRLTPSARHAPTFIQCDLTAIADLQAKLTRMVTNHGPFDILANNAANDDRHAFADVTPEYWDNRMAVNLKHLYFVAQAVVPGMIARGGGSIINFGSISWHLGLPELALYQTAKSAIEGMSRAMARDLGIHNIRVNTIIPGNVKTPRQMQWYTPDGEAEIVAAQCLKGRIMPVDIAAMALFLASDGARLCTGHNYWVDAGWR